MKTRRFVRFVAGFAFPEDVVDTADFEAPLRRVADALRGALLEEGMDVGVVEWQGIDFVIPCAVGVRQYRLSLMPDWVDGFWFLVDFEPTVGWFRKLLGQTEEAEVRELVAGLDRAIRRLPGTSDTRWYPSSPAFPSDSFSRTPF